MTKRVRQPPTAAIFGLHVGRPKGHCRWCGKAILGGAGVLATRAKWHPECVTEYKLLAWPAETRKAVSRRDHGVCHDCGADCRLSGDWDVDHVVPLWKVARLPDEERIRYFRLDNLVTRCGDCHKRKTAEEAAERAHHRRLADANNGAPKAKRPWPKRPDAWGSEYRARLAREAEAK